MQINPFIAQRLSVDRRRDLMRQARTERLGRALRRRQALLVCIIPDRVPRSWRFRYG
jgi:hypothetical protein